MNIKINQKILLNALERGALAALSEEAQSDCSNFSLITRGVRITVDLSSIIFESATSILASRYFVPVDTINGIVVKEVGSVMVPAKEFIEWVTKQGDSIVGLNLKKLDTPELIKGSDSEGDATNTVKKIGSLQVASKDSTNTGNRWQLDCYDTTSFPAINFSQKPKL